MAPYVGLLYSSFIDKLNQKNMIWRDKTGSKNHMIRSKGSTSLSIFVESCDDEKTKQARGQN